jgi:hypothetical protein
LTQLRERCRSTRRPRMLSAAGDAEPPETFGGRTRDRMLGLNGSPPASSIEDRHGSRASADSRLFTPGRVGQRCGCRCRSVHAARAAERAFRRGSITAHPCGRERAGAVSRATCMWHPIRGAPRRISGRPARAAVLDLMIDTRVAFCLADRSASSDCSETREPDSWCSPRRRMAVPSIDPSARTAERVGGGTTLRTFQVAVYLRADSTGRRSWCGGSTQESSPGGDLSSRDSRPSAPRRDATKDLETSSRYGLPPPRGLLWLLSSFGWMGEPRFGRSLT